MKGQLAERSPADILSDVQRRQASGVLRFQKGQVARQLFMDAGAMIRFAASTLPTESMTLLFCNKGGITQEQLREATAHKKGDELLGTTLTRLGFLTREQLHDLTEEHIRRVVHGLLCEAEGEYEFQQGALPFREQLDAGLATAQLLLEWCRDVPDPDWVQRRLGSLEARVQLSPRPPEGYKSVALSPAEGYTMSRVDGTASLREICIVSPMGEETTLRALCGLVLAGILETPDGSAAVPPPPRLVAGRPASTPTPPAGASQGPATGPQPHTSSPPTTPRPAPVAPAPRPATARPAVLPGRTPGNGGAPRTAPRRRPAPPAPRKIVHATERVRPSTGADLETEILQRFERMREQDLYQVLGVLSTASVDDVRRAYYALARKFHPDKFTREEIKAKAEKAFGHITEAYSTLSKIETRKKYDEDQALHKGPKQQETVDAADMARLNFKHGKEMYDRGKFGEALSFLQNACEQDPKKAEYFHLLALTQAKNPRWKKDAETHFIKAIELDPTNADIYAQLGSLYARGGLHSKAKEMWHRALQWDPANDEAVQGLAAEEGGGAKKGLLGIFKK
jgi:Flp pilus assembly protein TadD